MITHLVLFEPHTSLSTDQRRAILETVAAALKRCPTVRACRIGRRVLHGLPGYERAMRQDYAYALMLEFDDLDGLRAYLTDREHGPVGEFFTSAASSSLGYDYEMTDLDAAGTIL